jgi:aspartate-semialdehyde dehydrogenase
MDLIMADSHSIGRNYAMLHCALVAAAIHAFCGKCMLKVVIKKVFTMAQSGLTVAVLGATGLVGSNILAILAERQFPIGTLKCLASEKSVGQPITVGAYRCQVELACPEAFDGVDIVLASAGGAISAQLVPEAVKRGAVVVDNTSHFRMEPTVPLVVAGVNDDDIAQHQGIIANPNCSTAQLMPVLKALDAAFGLKRVIVSTYQSVSGAGKKGLDGLSASVEEASQGGATTIAPFQRPMGYNLIPHIDVFVTEGPLAGYTKEEAKLILETQKILHRPDLPVTATAVRVPVQVGHSESVTIDTVKPITPEAAIAVLQALPPDLVVVGDAPQHYHTPRETAGTDPVYVSRIRQDSSNPGYGLNMWVVADNLRIGAALNAVRIAEQVAKRLTQATVGV